jgi:hypothetical protein
MAGGFSQFLTDVIDKMRPAGAPPRPANPTDDKFLAILIDVEQAADILGKNWPAAKVIAHDLERIRPWVPTIEHFLAGAPPPPPPDVATGNTDAKSPGGSQNANI